MVTTRLFLIVALILMPTLFGLSKFYASIRPLHELCLKSFNDRHTQILTHELGSALICGKNLSPGPLRQLFTELGLYHILVVSGAHLTWLTAIIMFLFPNKPNTTFFCLVLFSLMTGLQAPILRALIELSLRSLPLPSWLTQLGSVFGCLVFNPHWLHSRSLFLSALARQTLRSDLNLLFNAARVQLVLLPLLMDFYLPTVLSVVFAGVISLALEILLFPLLIGVFIFPGLSSLSEKILETFVITLKELLAVIPRPNFNLVFLSTWPPSLYWLAIFLLLSQQNMKKRREWFFKKRSE